MSLENTSEPRNKWQQQAIDEKKPTKRSTLSALG